MSATMFSQENRVIKVSTPLGKDVLLLEGFSGQEAISSLFQFHLDLTAENERNVAFDKLLGQRILIEVMLPNDQTRYLHGIVSSFSQGGRGERFTKYRAEMVPQFWLLTRRVQSRIFQQISVPDILKRVLQGLDVSFELQGTYESRDYCVQYRESDFQFASRLMEEEGIYYFFKHAEDGHKMVVADSPQSHPDLPEGSRIIYDEINGGTREEERIHRWEKQQELRSGKYTLWDHCFELPYKHLEAEKTVVESLSVGKVAHKLKVGGNDKLEIYDFPGAYAQRFDGVDPGGGDRSPDLQRIFEDNKRTVNIRLQQETVPALVINGASDCRNFVSGHKFNLAEHFNADGQYVLTSVSHAAQHEIGSGKESAETHYSNDFTCIPFALPFRPQRITPRPVVHGSHTATVTGPKGSEIFTDKYGRVKVQFHWDREGKNDENSSCWIRVSSGWAAKGWGMVQIPRIGQEVVVNFIEGDPDQPIIVGCVYNADQMPPYKLPDNKVMGGWKSNSSPGGGGYNEISFNDTKGKEMFTLHAQYDMAETVEHDQTSTVHNNRTTTVDVNDKETVGSNQTIAVGADQKITVGANQTEQIGASEKLAVGANQTITVGAKRSVTVGASETINISTSQSVTAGATISITAGASITLTAGGASIVIGSGGITMTAPGTVAVTAGLITHNG
ncbi:MAG: type VI secretion system tip protein VgrG [Acidobacteriia bacterium]|nr:type VI secretion system tip protein VgrG [Terriglobia bacterium]